MRGPAVAGLTLLLAACGHVEDPVRSDPADGVSETAHASITQEEDPAMSTTSAPVDASLVAQVSPPGELGAPYPSGIQGVTVTYTVTNQGSDPVVVIFERGHGQSSSSTAPQTPEAAWVGASDSPGIARLSKQIFDAPGEATLATPWRAPAQLVQGGESVEGRMLVPFPLRADLPSSSDILTVTDQPLAGDERQVEVCVQVAPDPRASHPGAFVDEITHATPGRTLICSEPEQLPEAGA